MIKTLAEREEFQQNVKSKKQFLQTNTKKIKYIPKTKYMQIYLPH